MLDRFGQIEPRVLFCADGYRYAGKEIDCLARAREVGRGFRAIERVVVVPYLRRQPDLDGVPRRGRMGRRSLGAIASAARASSGSRSTIRSTSCIPRAPPDFPSAWCTARAARCFST